MLYETGKIYYAIWPPDSALVTPAPIVFKLIEIKVGSVWGEEVQSIITPYTKGIFKFILLAGDINLYTDSLHSGYFHNAHQVPITDLPLYVGMKYVTKDFKRTDWLPNGHPQTEYLVIPNYFDTIKEVTQEDLPLYINMKYLQPKFREALNDL